MKNNVRPTLRSEYGKHDGQTGHQAALTPSQREKLLTLGNGDLRRNVDTSTQRLLPDGMTIVHHFMHMAHLHPDRQIVVDERGAYTCSQLNRYSNRVARWMTGQGIQRGDAVAVLVPRCKEYAVLSMGVLKAGGALVTLEEDYPQQRRQHIMSMADAKAVLTLDTLQDVLGSDVKDDDICLCEADDVFQIFFTSGTTGNPKGVITYHRAIAFGLNNQVKCGLLTNDTVMACITRLSFVASLRPFWFAIAYGATTHIIPSQMIFDHDGLAEYIARNHITCAMMSASYGVMFINNYDVPLHDLILAAEKIQPITNRNVRVTNMYGSTEVPGIASKTISPDDEHLTVGIPMPGTKVYILDEQQNLLPQGVVGEICISSMTLSRGYLNDEEMNGRKFITNPFDRSTLLYRSGDLGFWDENGELNVMGRMDNMVKLNGLRIELDEISYMAMQLDGIELCACLKWGDEGMEYLCCYYTSAAGITDEALKAHLIQSLPAYMVPQTYVLLDRMPLNANGKIDRKALPEPHVSKEKDVALPASDDERSVLEVVRELIGMDDIGVTDNLVCLGLSSVKAMHLAMRIRQTLRRDISVPQLLANPTVRHIAANLAQTSDHKTDRPSKEVLLYPLTDTLQYELRLLSGNQGKVYFNVTHCYHFRKGTIDAERLQRAIVAAIDATPIMKVRAVCKDDGTWFLQRRDKAPAAVSLTSIDYAPDYDYFCQRIKPFDPFTEDWYRISITQCHGETFLFMDMLHLLLDGISLSQFINKISEEYHGRNIARERYTYYDYLLDIKSHLLPSQTERGDTWYGNMMKQCGPIARLCGTQTSFTGVGRQAIHSFILDAPYVARLCKEHGATESDVLLTIVMMAMQKVTRSERLVMGTYINERYDNTPTLFNMVGYMLAVALVATDHRIDTNSIGEEIRQLKQQTAISYTLPHFPFSRLVHNGNMTEDDRYLMPLFIYQGGVLDNTDNAFGRHEEKWNYDNPYAQDGLLIEVVPMANGKYSISLRYDVKYFSPDVISSLSNEIARQKLISNG